MKEKPELSNLVKKKGVEEQKLDGELLISDPNTGQVYILNETASIIWQLSDGRHTHNYLNLLILSGSFLMISGITVMSLSDNRFPNLFS